MAVPYRLVKSRNPLTGQAGYAARAIWSLTSREDLIERLADETSVGPGDISAVVSRLGKVIAAELKAGRAVHVDGIGTFYVSIRSILVNAPDQFVPTTHLEGGRVRFKAHPLFQKLGRDLTLKISGPRPSQTPQASESEGDGQEE